VSNNQLYTAISAPRFERYLRACGFQERAIALYRANITLSRQLYGVIGVFEVILRNSIDRHMIAQQGDEWLENASAPGGYFDISVGCEDIFHYVQEAIHKLGAKYTHDALIAKLTFGFWTYMFAPKEFAASGSTLLVAFPNRPFGTKQKVIFQNLIKINDLRNRIAHHEPICFENNTVSTNRAERRYKLILELLEWLGCNPKQILSGIDGVSHPLARINKIITES
jgi:hypothetical protein